MIVISNTVITALFLFLIPVPLLQIFCGGAGPAMQCDGSTCERKKEENLKQKYKV